MREIEEIVKDIISNCVNVQVDKIQINENITNYGVSSMDFIKIVVSIENEFAIEFEDENLDFNKFPSAQSLVYFVRSKLD